MTTITDFGPQLAWWDRLWEALRTAIEAPTRQREAVDARRLGIHPKDFLSIGHG